MSFATFIKISIDSKLESRV